MLSWGWWWCPSSVPASKSYFPEPPCASHLGLVCKTGSRAASSPKVSKRPMVFPAVSCLGTDGQWRLHVFKGSHFWEVTADGNVSEPRALQKRWPGLPPNIEAAAVSLEDGDFYFFKGISPESAEIATRRRGWGWRWGGPTRSEERGGSPAMSPWWNSLLNLWPRKDSFQGWSWEQQVSRWSSGIETVGGGLLSSLQVSRKSGGVCPAILAV